MSSNPKNNLLTIHMRKTKKRVTAATKLQALARHTESSASTATTATTCPSVVCLQVLSYTTLGCEVIQPPLGPLSSHSVPL